MILAQLAPALAEGPPLVITRGGSQVVASGGTVTNLSTTQRDMHLSPAATSAFAATRLRRDSERCKAHGFEFEPSAGRNDAAEANERSE